MSAGNPSKIIQIFEKNPWIWRAFMNIWNHHIKISVRF